MIINSIKRPFGIGPKVSIFTLGTMRATNSLDKMYGVIKSAYSAGINHIETAPSYGNSEKLIGMALEKLEQEEKVNKNKWVITTKILPRGNIEQLKVKFKQSKKNLKIDRIHNLAIHGINLKEHLDWVLKGPGKIFVNWIIKNNLAEQLGFSSHGDYELIDQAIDSDLFNFCNLHLHLFDKSKIPLAKKALSKKMGVLAISPADKGGQLYAPSKLLKKDSKTMHPLELAYRYLISEGITTLSLGASKEEDFHLAIKLANSTSELNENEINIIKNIEDQSSKRLGDSKCGQCRECLPCPSKIPIPEILRLRNIAIGNGQMKFSKERYNLIGRAGHWWEIRDGSDCRNCNFCIPKCPNDLDIPQLLKETHEMLIENPKRRLWG